MRTGVDGAARGTADAQLATHYNLPHTPVHRRVVDDELCAVRHNDLVVDGVRVEHAAGEEDLAAAGDVDGLVGQQRAECVPGHEVRLRVGALKPVAFLQQVDVDGERPNGCRDVTARRSLVQTPA